MHVAPLVLNLDDRAHQLFVGFHGADFDRLREVLTRRWGDSVPVWERTSGEWRAVPLREVSGDFAIPAQSAENPGGVYGLVWVVDRLLGPGGCPWDQEQTHESLKRYLIEESYELIDAIDRSDDAAMREELGDVLLQPLMHTQKKHLEGAWSIEEVAQGITEKLIRRHPHVFGEVAVEDAAEVLRNWDAIKRAEKKDAGAPEVVSILAGVPRAMPALLLAQEVSKRAARAGFEWPDFEGVWAKFHEEEQELRDALASEDRAAVESELGDLLFTVVNLARWAKVDAEDALRTMVNRFRGRFERMEELAGRPLSELSAEEWDDLWNQAKREGSGSAN